jgi:hypothetical protein
MRVFADFEFCMMPSGRCPNLVPGFKWCFNNYYVPVICIPRGVMIFMRETSITRATGRGGPWKCFFVVLIVLFKIVLSQKLFPSISIVLAQKLFSSISKMLKWSGSVGLVFYGSALRQGGAHSRTGYTISRHPLHLRSEKDYKPFLKRRDPDP